MIWKVQSGSRKAACNKTMNEYSADKNTSKAYLISSSPKLGGCTGEFGELSVLFSSLSKIPITLFIEV